jgi:uncharacterized membrane protein
MKQTNLGIYISIISIFLGISLIINAFLNLPSLNFKYSIIAGAIGLFLLFSGYYLFKRTTRP